MAKKSFVTTTIRKIGSDIPIKLDIDECRAIGRKTKRLLKSGVPVREAKIHSLNKGL